MPREFGYSRLLPSSYCATHLQRIKYTGSNIKTLCPNPPNCLRHGGALIPRQGFEAVQRVVHAGGPATSRCEEIEGQGGLLFAGTCVQQRPFPQPEPDFLQDIRCSRDVRSQGKCCRCLGRRNGRGRRGADVTCTMFGSSAVPLIAACVL